MNIPSLLTLLGLSSVSAMSSMNKKPGSASFRGTIDDFRKLQTDGNMWAIQDSCVAIHLNIEDIAPVGSAGWNFESRKKKLIESMKKLSRARMRVNRLKIDFGNPSGNHNYFKQRWVDWGDDTLPDARSFYESLTVDYEIVNAFFDMLGEIDFKKLDFRASPIEFDIPVDFRISYRCEYLHTLGVSGKNISKLISKANRGLKSVYIASRYGDAAYGEELDLSDLHGLEVLQITGKLKAIPKMTGPRKSLKKLFISQYVGESFSKETSRMKALREVYVYVTTSNFSSDINFSGSTDLEILKIEAPSTRGSRVISRPCTINPKMLSKCWKLDTLVLSGLGIKIIPVEICGLIGLTKVSFNNNQITTIPDCLFDMPRLKILKITSNPLRGFSMRFWREMIGGDTVIHLASKSKTKNREMFPNLIIPSIEEIMASDPGMNLTRAGINQYERILQSIPSQQRTLRRF